MSILDNILGTESEVISIEEDQRPHHYLWNFKHIEDVVPLLSNSFESIPLETIQNKNFIVIFGIAGRSGTIGFIDSTHSVLTFNVAIVPYDSEFKHLSLMSTSELHYLTDFGPKLLEQLVKDSVSSEVDLPRLKDIISVLPEENNSDNQGDVHVDVSMKRERDENEPKKVVRQKSTCSIDLRKLTYEEYVQKHYENCRQTFMIENGMIAHPPPHFSGGFGGSGGYSRGPNSFRGRGRGGYRR